MSYKEIANNLLYWFEENKRDLPWRQTKNPYYIWISEIMLQQTQVETVKSYYIKFIKQYPNITDLAKANEDEVLKLWEGLGYYSRAKRLMACAKIVVDKYQGKFPKDKELMLKLPGIGPYTAGAILSIAYNRKAPAVDGNVFRVISRIFNITEDITKPKSRKTFEKVTEDLLSSIEKYGDLNQSLMELGAMVCTPLNPKCKSCPIMTLCEGVQTNIQEFLPVKTKNKSKVSMSMEVAWVTYKEKIMLTRRPEEGMLGGLWGFPIVEKELPQLGQSIKLELEEQYGLQVNLEGVKGQAKHIFTHRIWQMTLFHYTAKKDILIEYPEIMWVTYEEMLQFPMPTAFRKLL
jgi:A/G-specific adenine glycosylase